jgi:hypothetical protein
VIMTAPCVIFTHEPWPVDIRGDYESRGPNPATRYTVERTHADIRITRIPEPLPLAIADSNLARPAVGRLRRAAPRSGMSKQGMPTNIDTDGTRGSRPILSAVWSADTYDAA